MSKSHKQKNKQQKNKKRQSLPKVSPSPLTIEPLASQEDLLIKARQEESIQPEELTPTDVELDATLEVKPLISDHRALLLAKQKQQPKGWKQQVKSGKMVSAHVPKRFNRGG